MSSKVLIGLEVWIGPVEQIGQIGQIGPWILLAVILMPMKHLLVLPGRLVHLLYLQQAE